MPPTSTDLDGSDATASDATDSDRKIGSGSADLLTSDPDLERRGLWWLLGAFLFCPCHLPVSIGVLTAVLAGTGLGAVMRDHSWIAGTLITVAWLAGTAYGFHLIRQAKRAGGACPTGRP